MKEALNLKESVSDIEKVTLSIIYSALDEVARKYGSGFSDGKNLRFYHNLVHTKNVLEATREIAKLAIQKGNIEEGESRLVALAAAAHDIEQDFSGGVNEKESANFIENEMKEAGVFSTEDIKRVGEIILATTVVLEGSNIQQSPTNDYLTKIIADADLSALGQPSELYWSSAKNLLKEIKGTSSPSLEDQLEWAYRQAELLSKHEYYTDEAKNLFPYQNQNLQFIKTQIMKLESEIKNN